MIPCMPRTRKRVRGKNEQTQRCDCLLRCSWIRLQTNKQKMPLRFGWSGIFSSADHPALANYVKMILQEMQTRSLNYDISVRGLFVALIT